MALEGKKLEQEDKKLELEDKKLTVDMTEKEAQLKLDADKNAMTAMNDQANQDKAAAELEIKKQSEADKIIDSAAARKEQRDHEARTAGLPPEDEMSELSEAIQAQTAAMTAMMQAQMEQSQQMMQVFNHLAVAITAPKELTYNEQGRPSGSVTVMPEQLN